QRHQSELHAIARLKIHHGKLEAEGQGIGRALLQAGQDWARANRYSKLTLAVFKENERAKQVYEHQGWRSELETGTNHWFDRRGAQGRPNRWLASRDLLA